MSYKNTDFQKASELLLQHKLSVTQVRLMNLATALNKTVTPKIILISHGTGAADRMREKHGKNCAYIGKTSGAQRKQIWAVWT